MNTNNQENVNKTQTQIDINTMCTTLLARTEAVQIVINVLNAIIGAKNQAGTPFSDGEIAAIQAAIDVENERNMSIYNQIHATVNANIIKTADASDEAPSEIADDTNVNTVSDSSSAAMDLLTREEFEKQSKKNKD